MTEEQSTKRRRGSPAVGTGKYDLPCARFWRKGAVADAVIELTNEFKQKRASFAANETQIEHWISQAGEKARGIAHETLVEVRKLTGLR